MPHRVFKDAGGTEWTVWSVFPGSAERRSELDRRQRSAGEWRGPERRSGVDRRSLREPRVRVSPNLRAGWLAFECSLERRRYAPPPPGWEQLPDDDLARLCQSATVVARRRRLIE